jgi:hypothetical protein
MAEATLSIAKRIDCCHAGRDTSTGWLVTVWPAPAAAAIVLGLAFSPIVSAAPSATAAGQSAPVSVTMIAALTAPERTTGFINPQLLAGYTSEFGLLTRQLDQLINRPVVIGIDPSILASIRILGSSAPASATAWLARLDSADNETFPLAWADSDLTAPLQAGSPALVLPESIDFAIDPTLFAAPVEPESPTPTPEPTQTPDPEGTLPTAASLVAWDYTVPSIAWPRMNSVTSGDLPILDGAFETTILSSENTGLDDARSARKTINDAQVLVSDASLTALFNTAVDAGPEQEWQAAMAALATAVGSVASTTADPASVLLALDRGVETSDTDLGPTIDALSTAPNVQVLGLAALLRTSTHATDLVEKPYDSAMLTAVAKLLVDESLDREFAVIAENPALITGQRRLDLLAVLSNSWADSPYGWEIARVTYDTASVALRNRVKIVQSSTITLWADRASLPVTVSNELAQAVTVYVRVRPVTPLLKVENSFVAVTVEPNSQRKASIPVQSLSNGSVELVVTVNAVTGKQIGATTYVRTTVQAGWETPFTIGVGIVVVLIFALGILRTIFRRRAARDQG